MMGAVLWTVDAWVQPSYCGFKGMCIVLCTFLEQLACQTVLFLFICFEKIALSSFYDLNEKTNNKRIHTGAKNYISLHLYMHFKQFLTNVQ